MKLASLYKIATTKTAIATAIKPYSMVVTPCCRRENCRSFFIFILEDIYIYIRAGNYLPLKLPSLMLAPPIVSVSSLNLHFKLWINQNLLMLGNTASVIETTTRLKIKNHYLIHLNKRLVILMM